MTYKRVIQSVVFNLFSLTNRIREYIIKKNRISYWRGVTKIRMAQLPPPPICNILTDEERAEIDRFYSKYTEVNPIFHEFYKKATGKFDVRNIPDDIYYSKIDPFYNDWEYAAKIDNKTFYKWMFRNIKQPSTICYRQNGFWLDSDSKPLPCVDVVDYIKNYPVAFIKYATLSMGGKGILVYDESTTLKELSSFISASPNDIIVQEAIRQSKEMAELNPSSVNTIRIVTLLRKDCTVKICSICVRMGLKGSRVDNASSGGIVVGVEKTGRLKSIAYGPDGKSYSKHPTSGVDFDEIVIPSFDKVKEVVTKEALATPLFRLISWDIAIDHNEEPVLIEANLFVGELEFHQLNNGPIFGEETEEVLNEVFMSKKKISYPF